MRLSVLMDDRACSPQFSSEHGLSFFLETAQGPLLFDAGTTGLFLDNANTMGLPISQVKWTVLSHGHVDHGGGLPFFLQANSISSVYLRKEALEGHYTTRKDGEIQCIGLPPSLAEESRMVFLTKDFPLSDSLFIFSSPSYSDFQSRSNSAHLVQTEDGYRPDDFAHEQSLLITEGNRTVLIAGCAHRGIVNILRRAIELAGRPMDAVVGGFHLSNPRDGGSEGEDILHGVGNYLSQFPTQYYTCHCTGAPAFSRLKQQLGDQLHEIAAGSQLLL